MAITRIDPRTALLLIDLQKGVLVLPTVQPVGPVLANAQALAQGFRRVGLPVVLVNVVGAAPGRVERARPATARPADWADLDPALDPQPGDYRVSKRCWGAFLGTGLEAHLRGLGITQVVIAGIATSIGVESSARQAFELGFNVTLAIDAMADLDGDAHANTITRIFPRLGETGSTVAILEWLPRLPSQ